MSKVFHKYIPNNHGKYNPYELVGLSNKGKVDKVMELLKRYSEPGIYNRPLSLFTDNIPKYGVMVPDFLIEWNSSFEKAEKRTKNHEDKPVSIIAYLSDEDLYCLNIQTYFDGKQEIYREYHLDENQAREYIDFILNSGSNLMDKKGTILFDGM